MSQIKKKKESGTFASRDSVARTNYMIAKEHVAFGTHGHWGQAKSED